MLADIDKENDLRGQKLPCLPPDDFSMRVGVARDHANFTKYGIHSPHENRPANYPTCLLLRRLPMVLDYNSYRCPQRSSDKDPFSRAFVKRRGIHFREIIRSSVHRIADPPFVRPSCREDEDLRREGLISCDLIPAATFLVDGSRIDRIAFGKCGGRPQRGFCWRKFPGASAGYFPISIKNHCL